MWNYKKDKGLKLLFTCWLSMVVMFVMATLIHCSKGGYLPFEAAVMLVVSVGIVLGTMVIVKKNKVPN